MHKLASTTARAFLFAGMAGTLAIPVRAALVAFSGTQMNVDSAAAMPAARCGARVTVRIGNGPDSSSTGLSNLGSFESTQSHCIAPPPPTSYDLGQFTYDFTGGTSLYGTYDGALSLGNAPGVFANLQNFLVTGGTGLFAGATGSFTGVGTVDFTGPTPRANLAFNGLLNLPGVPEPSQWALFVSGFGLVGGAIRRARPQVRDARQQFA